MRFDNGFPWGTKRKLPTALGLWLVGLGIELSYGRPARSTDNAVIERSHGVLANWVEAYSCQTEDELQQRLNWAVNTQRTRYRLSDGQTRYQKFPQLEANTRGYDSQRDSVQWSYQRVWQYLSQFRFRRKVEKNGRITLFANNYSVGREYAGHYIDVRLDDLTVCWVMYDDYGRELRRHPAQEIVYEAISHLKLAKRRRN